jgi:hypothetical protein
LRKEFAVMAKGGKAAKWAARGERLSAALRENLKRRKQQAKGRQQAGDPVEHRETPAPETGSEAQNPDFRRNPGGE